MTLTLDQFTGCMLGLALGDALGAPYEGGVLERLVWRLIGRTRDGRLRWTDDTQMALDLAESLLARSGLQPDDLARRFAASYSWTRGYGPGTARVLKRIRRGESWEAASRAVYPNGSYGNGAAMRSPILALFFAHDYDALVAAARDSARITHAHPLGIEGAVLVAVATHALLFRNPPSHILDAVRAECRSPEMTGRLEAASAWLSEGATPSPREVAKRLGNGTTAATSCVTALYIGLRHLERSFEEMMQFVIACGGDTDTLGAMAGALWGAWNGAAGLPTVALEKREDLEAVTSRLFARTGQSSLANQVP